MIGVALAMIRVRSTHAAIVGLLAVLAVGAAVAAPRYVDAARASVTRVDLAAADRASTTILSDFAVIAKPDPTDPRQQQQASAQRAKDFLTKGLAALTIPEFSTTIAVGFYARMSGSPLPPIPHPESVPPEPQHWLEFRDGVCDHLSLSSGRCPAAAGEVVVGTKTAADLNLRTGSALYQQNMFFHDRPDEDPYWSPTGAPAALTVVGIYRPVDPTDPFFTGAVPVTEGGDEPVYTTRRTVATLDHYLETQRVLAYPTRELSPDDLVALTLRIRAAIDAIRAVNTQPQTSMPVLLDRIATDRAQVSVLPGVLELPLVILCCFVIFLAASNTAQARRTELGMLKLRGAAAQDRVGLAAAELVAPLVAGGVAGYLLGQVAVWLLARLILTGPTSLSLSFAYAPQAALALLAVVVAGLLGLRRDLVAPVADLLRRVPARGGRWGSVVLRTVVVVLGVAAVVQVHTSDAPLRGLGVLAPAAVILAVALVLAAAFDPIVGASGRRALRRGRLGSALAMLHLGRRRTGSRVVALLGVAVGLLAFVAVAFGTGNQARADQVKAELGARQVVTVPEMTMRDLLQDVRAADPDGKYAMAVMPIGAAAPILAIDSTRLAAIDTWSNQGPGGLDPAAVQAALRPGLAKSIDVTGTGLTLTVGMNPASAKSRVHLAVVLAPLDGAIERYVRLSPTAPGADTYHADVTCPVGCRLVTLAITDFEPPTDPLDAFYGRTQSQPVTLTLTRIVQSGPDQDLATPADLGSWTDRQAAEVSLEPSEAGLAITVGHVVTGQNLPAWVGPDDQPTQLPIVAASSLQDPPLTVPVPVPAINHGSLAIGSNGPTVLGRLASRTPLLPRLGTSGVLVDMEYLARMGEPGPHRTGGEVWLGPAAPPDALDRLRAAGLTVTGVRSYDDELARASGGPNATGLQFLLAVGALCLALGAGGLAVAATVERRARADELRSLRRQGASRWAVARAGWQSYLVIVISGAAAGGMAAAVAWLATRGSLPVVDTLVAGVPVPDWPGWTPVVAWGMATVVLGLVAVGLTAALSGATRSVRGRNR